MRPLEVTWVPDETISPPGPKMVVCISPMDGWYFRINSENHWVPCVAIAKTPNHEFLKWDSHIECNILELDDYIIDEAVRRSGIIGAVSADLCEEIRAAIRGNRNISNSDKAVIHQIMQALGR